MEAFILKEAAGTLVLHCVGLDGGNLSLLKLGTVDKNWGKCRYVNGDGRIT